MSESMPAAADEDKKRRIAAECWKAGTAALGKQNWDYSIKMFLTCAQMFPANLMYRQSLRGAEGKKYGDSRKGSSLAFMSMPGIKSRVKKHKAKKEWDLADRAAEEGLMLNPWDAQLNADLGESCFARGFHEVAKFAYTRAVECAPENRELLMQLADVLEANAEYDQAIGVWERIHKMDPYNPEARSKIPGLMSKKTIDRGGYEGAKSTQEAKLGYEERVSGGGPKDLAPGESIEKDLQMAIRKDPANKDNYIKLGDQYRRSGKLEEAHQVYERAVQVSGGDHTIREQMEDIELDLMKRNVDLAKAEADRSTDNPDARKHVIELSREMLNREIEIRARRVERYPNDLKQKFELGNLYIRGQKWPNAIPLLQQSTRDQRIEPAARIALGKCFIMEKKPELALRQFKSAAEKLNEIDHADQFKDAHYMCGRIYEDLKDSEQALTHYNEVLGVDFDYKDVRARIERLESQAK